MAQIRRKTVCDHRAALRRARERGISLSWNRYEGMLPQDGFARLGLTCFDCLLGPCRVNPFAREEERTVCGFGPDDLVYRTLMRLLGSPTVDGDHVDSILSAARAVLEHYRPGEGGGYRIGPGVLEEGKPNVCIEAVNPEQLAALAGAGLNVVTVGSLAAGYGCVSSIGEAEFALLTGLVDAYVTCPRCISLPRGASEALHTAVISCDDTAAILAAAKESFGKRGDILPDGFAAEISAVPMNQALEQAGENAVVIGGGSNLKLTLDELALDAVKAFADRPVVICGGAAVSLAKYGLENVIWCCEDASALLRCSGAGKPPVLLPEIFIRRGIAEALALGEAGFPVLTATELPLGNGLLGERLGALVRYVKPDEFLNAAKEV